MGVDIEGGLAVNGLVVHARLDGQAQALLSTKKGEEEEGEEGEEGGEKEKEEEKEEERET